MSLWRGSRINRNNDVRRAAYPQSNNREAVHITINRQRRVLLPVDVKAREGQVGRKWVLHNEIPSNCWFTRWWTRRKQRLNQFFYSLVKFKDKRVDRLSLMNKLQEVPLGTGWPTLSLSMLRVASTKSFSGRLGSDEPENHKIPVNG